MMRKYLLLMSAVLAASIPAVPAVAGDIPCPVDQVVNETRANNDKQGKRQPDVFYQRLAENYRKQCSKAEAKISTLLEQLKEYRDGKRGDRDGYVILQKIANSYATLRAGQTAQAREIKTQLDALIKKHPDYPRMQDFRLSEEINAEKKQRSAQDEISKKAAAWTPEDRIPLAIVESGNRLIAIHQFRIAFYARPADVHLSRKKHQRLMLIRQVGDSEQTVALEELRPTKTLTFQQVIDVRPPNLRALGDSHLLVCTNPASYYSAMSPSEREILTAKGRAYGTIRSIDTRGSYRDFCGVISQSGEIVFNFSATQRSPDKLFMPLGIADNGMRAAVAVGEKVVDEGEDGEVERVGKIREVQIWEQGALRSVKKLPPFENTNELEALFLDHKL
jgi:hypothetical protein